MNLKEQMKIPKTVQRKYRNERIRTNMRPKLKGEGKRSRIANILIEFIKNNIKEYMIITLTFLIGIFLGVMFVNNLEEEPKLEIISYVNTYIESFEKSEQASNIKLLQNNIKDNIILTLIIWFIGSTIIGIPIVFGVILYRARKKRSFGGTEVIFRKGLFCHIASFIEFDPLDEKLVYCSIFTKRFLLLQKNKKGWIL